MRKFQPILLSTAITMLLLVTLGTNAQTPAKRVLKTTYATGTYSASPQAARADNDGDGYSTPSDCNDNNPNINPGETEICGNSIDEDCSGSLNNGCGIVDNDGDGYNSTSDCNDNNPNINPGETEVCGNSIDEDCSGSLDNGCGGTDNDGDGYGTASDCNDYDPYVHPGATEICGNLIDEDCNGVLNNGCGGTDNDGDGYSNAVDCNDNNPNINPGEAEICGNSTDENCDGSTTAGCGTGTDNDGDGYSNSVDCDDNNPSIHPGRSEICGNSVDENCNGSLTDGCNDNDGDGYVANIDCNDNNPAIHPGASEICGNSVDENCNGSLIDGCGSFQDNDGDGYTASTDCNDQNPNINPGKLELCNNTVDENCDGSLALDCYCTDYCSTSFTSDMQYFTVNATDDSLFDNQYLDLDGLTPNAAVSPPFTGNWDFLSITENGHTNYLLGATSYFAQPGAANNWYILGPLTLTSNTLRVSWYHRYEDNNFRDGYALKLSTTNSQPASFTTTLWSVSDNDNRTDGDTTWTFMDVLYNGSAFVHQKYYLAFHHTAFDQFILTLDDIFVGWCGPSGPQPNGFRDVAKSRAEFDIVPNPSTGEFTLRYYFEGTDDLQVIVTDVMGRVVYTKSAFFVTEGHMRLSLNDQPTGVYYAQVKHGEKTQVAKLIISN